MHAPDHQNFFFLEADFESGVNKESMKKKKLSENADVP